MDRSRVSPVRQQLRRLRQIKSGRAKGLAGPALWPVYGRLPGDAVIIIANVQGRALVIHEGGDNYNDQPENGGGKGRVACGVVPKR